jgi:hypothetical protein
MSIHSSINDMGKVNASSLRRKLREEENEELLTSLFTPTREAVYSFMQSPDKVNEIRRIAPGSFTESDIETFSQAWDNEGAKYAFEELTSRISTFGAARAGQGTKIRNWWDWYCFWNGAAEYNGNRVDWLKAQDAWEGVGASSQTLLGKFLGTLCRWAAWRTIHRFYGAPSPERLATVMDDATEAAVVYVITDTQPEGKYGKEGRLSFVQSMLYKAAKKGKNYFIAEAALGYLALECVDKARRQTEGRAKGGTPEDVADKATPSQIGRTALPAPGQGMEADEFLTTLTIEELAAVRYALGELDQTGAGLGHGSQGSVGERLIAKALGCSRWKAGGIWLKVQLKALYSIEDSWFTKEQFKNEEARLLGKIADRAKA